MENNHEITTEELPRMIQKGFEGTPTKQEMNERFDKVEVRLERLELLMDNEYKRRIEKLEN